MRDKAMEEMLGALRPLFDQAIATGLPVARARAPQEVARAAEDLGFEALVVDDPGAALERAEALAGPEGLVVVCGSLYLVGEIRKRLRLA
jgi:dihydrofolate synthase / folylpolyglutamate synthase